MTDVRDFDRRVPRATNHVFEAHSPFDPTADFLWAWRGVGDGGVWLNFCEDRGARDVPYIKRTMWLDADQCEQFGKALLDAAGIIKAAGEEVRS